MVDSYLSTKFGISSLDGFWGNAFYGRTTDACATALALLTQSSSAKNAKIQNLKYHNSFNNFGRDPPKDVCVDFRE